MDLDPKISVAAFVRVIVKRLDGALLIALILSFMVFAAFPTATTIFGLVRSDATATDMRFAFFIMPFALVAEYVWFLSSTSHRQHSLLVCVVLLVTASLPFINTIRGFLQ